MLTEKRMFELNGDLVEKCGISFGMEVNLIEQ